MDEAGKTDVPVLAYARGQHGRTSRPPISRRFAVVLFLIATAPYILTATSPALLFLRPMSHCLCGGVMGAIALVVYVVKTELTPRVPDEPGKLAAINIRRVLAVIVAAIGFLILHASGLLLTLVFLLHYPVLKREAIEAARTLPPGGREEHGWIGLMPVQSIRRGADGEIAFDMDDAGIEYDPTPATREWFFVPPDAEGSLWIPGWRWATSD